jgi:phytoene dehydrogenase-like protein
MDYDVAIIGAGMSGLAAGIRLAYYGKKVCILEKHHRVGGLNSFYSRDGHKFDVGLHAMTNYVPKGVKSTPLPKLLRQLKLKAEDFDLCQQRVSAISFPGKTLRFTNELDFFVQEVNEAFPAQKDNFQKLLQTIGEYDALSLDAKLRPAREVVGSIVTDPVLVDMMFCPLMYYGNAQEHDMEFGQFVIMFSSIFCEGFARPHMGVRQILDVLVDKYKESGGELRLKRGIERIEVSGGRVHSLRLDSGEELTARHVLSSAGYVETMRLLSDHSPNEEDRGIGQLSFVEFIFVLDREMAHRGYDTTITFFNTTDRFRYRKPDESVDITSGVICCPNNFEYDEPLPEALIRVTNMANYDRWNGLDKDAYRREKTAWLERSLEVVVQFVPDFRDSIVYTDMFTPTTIHRYTGHLNGAVYGTPDKVKDGHTHLDNLYICGTDQGFLGIVGAMLSGISMANYHILQKD